MCGSLDRGLKVCEGKRGCRWSEGGAGAVVGVGETRLLGNRACVCVPCAGQPFHNHKARLQSFCMRLNTNHNNRRAY